MSRIQIILVPLLILSSSITSAEQHMSGTVSGTWMAAYSPYYVDGNCYIDEGAELTIEPGVEVIFSDSYAIYVSGALNAVGAPGDSISFVSAGWQAEGSISFWSLDSPMSTFQYCSFERLGGISSSSADVIIRDCSFRGFEYAALLLSNSVLVEDCVFEHHAEADEVVHIHAGGPIIRRCRFADNEYRAIRIDIQQIQGPAPSIIDCEFTNNGNAWDFGGAVYVEDGSAGIIGCVFADNLARLGGAIALRGNDPVSIRDCQFTGNYGESGGAVYAHGAHGTTISGCLFQGNVSENDGGAIDCRTTTLSVEQSLFVDNEAWERGGAISFYTTHSTQSCEVINCTFHGNSAGEVGGALHCKDLGGPIALDGCIVWNNSAPTSPEVYLTGSHITVDYCDVYGFLPGGTGNISVNPGFVDSAGGDLTLQPDSPCIDAANPTLMYDPDGTRRDMGYAFFDQRGNVEVVPLPAGIPFPWTIEGPDGYLMHGVDVDTLTVLRGDYTLTWQPHDGWDTPQPASLTLALAAQTTITFAGTYLEVVGVLGDQHGVPRQAMVAGSYPNPFNPSTEVAFGLARETQATVAIYSIDGCLVDVIVDEVLPAGWHRCQWHGVDRNGRAVPSGVYLARLVADGEVATARMLLAK